MSYEPKNGEYVKTMDKNKRRDANGRWSTTEGLLVNIFLGIRTLMVGIEEALPLPSLISQSFHPRSKKISLKINITYKYKILVNIIYKNLIY